MHYSRHRLTASVAYVTTLVYASTNNQWVCSACPLVISSKTKPCQFSSVLCTHLDVCNDELLQNVFLKVLVVKQIEVYTMSQKRLTGHF